jgi:transcription antitermination factor NusG
MIKVGDTVKIAPLNISSRFLGMRGKVTEIDLDSKIAHPTSLLTYLTHRVEINEDDWKTLFQVASPGYLWFNERELGAI